MRRTRRTERGSRLGPALVAWLAVLAAAAASADEQIEAPVVSEETDATRLPAVTRVPTYPPTARRERIEGEATVCFRIAPDGRILDPAVASSTHEIFEKPVLEAIRESSFEPLSAGEDVSGIPVCRTYRFRLDPVEVGESPSGPARGYRAESSGRSSV